VPSIAASFPETERREAVSRKFLPGTVVYVFCPFTNPPKEKYVILAATDEPPLLIVVNTTVHRFIRERPYMDRCQVLLGASDYTFLDHDSNANCAEVIDTMPLEEIITQLVADPSRIKGTLTPKSTSEVGVALGLSATVVPAQVHRIQSALK